MSTAAPVSEGLVILAGGVSSRMARSLAGATGAAPPEIAKGMLAFGEEGRPFLDYLLFNARDAGLRDIVIVVNERDRSIRDTYGPLDSKNAFRGLQISYSVQRIPPGRTKPLGTADALLQALAARPDWRGRFFLVCNSDNLYSVRAFAALLSLGGQGGWIDYDSRALRFPAGRIAQFGIPLKDADGYLTGMIEKPSMAEIEEVRRREGIVRVSMNIWRFRSDIIFPFLESCPVHPVRDEKELPAAVGLMVLEHRRSMLSVPLSEHVPDLTSADDLEEVRSWLAGHGGVLRW